MHRSTETPPLLRRSAWVQRAATFYDQIKTCFADCADMLRGLGDGEGTERFEKVSTHRMRHSHASHAIASGMPVEIAQKYLGQAWLLAA